MKFYAKTHGKTLAICDKEILGKKYEDGEMTLDVTKSFYKGQEIGEKQAQELIRTHENGIVTGNNAVRIAEKQNLDQHQTIKGIKYIVYTRI